MVISVRIHIILCVNTKSKFFSGKLVDKFIDQLWIKNNPNLSTVYSFLSTLLRTTSLSLNKLNLKTKFDYSAKSSQLVTNSDFHLAYLKNYRKPLVRI